MGFEDSYSSDLTLDAAAVACAQDNAAGGASGAGVGGAAGGDEGARGANYHVQLNDPAANAERSFPNNFIRTAKYTVWTFLPLNLFEQFRNAANLYFLLTCIVSLTPVSPLSPVTTISPLVFVVTVTAIKDGYEDYQRHKADKAANSAVYEVYAADNPDCGSKSAPRLAPVASADIRAGDIVKVNKGELFPADLVALASSEDHGLVYVETANLDGETNLKRRFTAPSMVDCRSLAEVAAMDGEVVCEPPTVKLYKFEGAVKGDAAAERADPLTHVNLLLRGSKLRNTEYVYGVVAYAGVDTKLFMNLKLAPAKISRAQVRLNKVVVGIFILNVLMLTSAGLFSGIAQARHTKSANHFGADQHDSPVEVGFLHCVSYFVLFTYLIPISLFVSVEIVRIGQQLFMNWDPDMATDRNDVSGTGMLCRDSNMNEELGEIDHVFADKTGTLTCNVMRLAQWSVGGRLYDQRLDPQCLGRAMSGEGPSVSAIAPPYDSALVGAGVDSQARSSGKSSNAGGKAKTDAVALDVLSSSSSSSYSSQEEEEEEEEEEAVNETIVNYLRAIALCHTVVPELLDDGTLNYEAESPDEAALVEAAAANGVVLRAAAGNFITIDVLGTVEDYETVAILEFTSDRKRMSILMRNPAGKYELFLKGADNLVMERLRDGDPLVDATQGHLESAAREGLRTLLVAHRSVPADVAESWLERYQDAQTATHGRAAAVAAACEELEIELELLGATAVEDRLQDNVPETLEFLLQAGVYVWVLTGDKRETAENIGYSSKLLAQGVDLIRLLAETEGELVELIDFHNKRIHAGALASDYALITDGHTLAIALESAPLVFLELAQRCGAVICCRVTPLQKAQVVGLVKDNLGRNTLAIGDGANDVSMIQTAHIGVGVVGKEGNQAVRASDFAIHQFRFLAPLLAVHGKRSLIRLSLLIQFSFYKNIVVILPQYLFGFYSLWSAQIVYDEIILTVYNIICVALPPLYFGLWERRVSKSTLLSEPRLYKANSHIFDLTSVLLWIAEGLYHGTVAYYAVFDATVGMGAIYGSGQTGGLYVQGYMLSSVVVIVVLCKAALVTSHWNIFAALAYAGSIVSYLLFSALYLEAPMGSFNERALYTMGATFGSPAFWYAIPIVTALCLLPSYVLRFVLHQWAPEPWVIMREADRELDASERIR